MNTINNMLIDDEFRFDMLVDDELGEAERRELLAGLDDEPGGWRRCALAFLEAQSWKKELGAFLLEPADRKPAGQLPTKPYTKTPVRRSRRSRLGRHVATWSAVAASFLLAMFLGRELQDAWLSDTIAPVPGVPIDAVADLRAPVTVPARPEEALDGASRHSDAPSGPWQLVTLAGPDGTVGEIKLPAIERDKLDENWLAGVPAAMPADVLRALERTGHKVRQRRELLPLRMKDGRRLVVPVDQVDVHYVGGPAL